MSTLFVNCTQSMFHLVTIAWCRKCSNKRFLTTGVLVCRPRLEPKASPPQEGTWPSQIPWSARAGGAVHCSLPCRLHRSVSKGRCQHGRLWIMRALLGPRPPSQVLWTHGCRRISVSFFEDSLYPVTFASAENAYEESFAVVIWQCVFSSRVQLSFLSMPFALGRKSLPAPRPK